MQINEKFGKLGGKLSTMLYPLQKKIKTKTEHSIIVIRFSSLERWTGSVNTYCIITHQRRGQKNIGERWVKFICINILHVFYFSFSDKLRILNIVK